METSGQDMGKGFTGEKVTAQNPHPGTSLGGPVAKTWLPVQGAQV